MISELDRARTAVETTPATGRGTTPARADAAALRGSRARAGGHRGLPADGPRAPGAAGRATRRSEGFCTLVRNMGRLGIPMLCYNWMAGVNWVRTRHRARGRGGALVTGFRLADLPATSRRGRATAARSSSGRRRSASCEIVVPVAEKAGVRLALHPDDPPIARVRGIDRIMNSVETFERAIALRRERGQRDLPLPGQLHAVHRRRARRDPPVRRRRAASRSGTSATSRHAARTSSRRSTTRA